MLERRTDKPKPLSKVRSTSTLNEIYLYDWGQFENRFFWEIFPLSKVRSTSTPNEKHFYDGGNLKIDAIKDFSR